MKKFSSNLLLLWIAIMGLFALKVAARSTGPASIPCDASDSSYTATANAGPMGAKANDKTFTITPSSATYSPGGGPIIITITGGGNYKGFLLKANAGSFPANQKGGVCVGEPTAASHTTADSKSANSQYTWTPPSVGTGSVTFRALVVSDGVYQTGIYTLTAAGGGGDGATDVPTNAGNPTNAGTSNPTNAGNPTNAATDGPQSDGPTTPVGEWSRYYNYCVSSSSQITQKTNWPGGDANADDCKEQCQQNKMCSAVEWYENGWGGSRCNLILDGFPAVQGATTGIQWEDAECHVKPGYVNTACASSDPQLCGGNGLRLPVTDKICGCRCNPSYTGTYCQTELDWAKFDNFCVTSDYTVSQVTNFPAGDGSIFTCKNNCEVDDRCSAIEWYETGAGDGVRCKLVLNLGQNPASYGANTPRLADAECHVKPVLSAAVQALTLPSIFFFLIPFAMLFAKE